MLALLLTMISVTGWTDEPAHVSAAASAPPTADEVRRVMNQMKADPALSGHHTDRQLRWKNLDDNKPRARSSLPHWLKELVSWFANAGRGIAWLLGAVVVAVLAVFAWRWAQVRADVQRSRIALLPSHVNALDIRPESLPADIAGSARALCGRGELRAALSLLYRGALSRLVHDHHVPIRASSTEGECMRLAARALSPAGSSYFEHLIATWQTEVYAGRAAESAGVAVLCTAFDTHFAARPIAAIAPNAVTA